MGLFDDVQVTGDVVAEEKMVEYAIVLVTKRGGIFLVGRGDAIESDVEVGMELEETGPTPHAPEELGLWLWQGIPSWQSGVTSEGIDEGAEPIFEKRGTWRRLGEDELRLFAAGEFHHVFVALEAKP